MISKSSHAGDHDYEIRIEATDKLYGEFRESQESIKLNVEEFFEVMGFSETDLDIEINKVE